MTIRPLASAVLAPGARAVDPTLSDIAACNQEAARRDLPRQAPLVKGMDALRADDPDCREAYRACMRARAARH